MKQIQLFLVLFFLKYNLNIIVVQQLWSPLNHKMSHKSEHCIAFFYREGQGFRHNFQSVLVFIKQINCNQFASFDFYIVSRSGSLHNYKSRSCLIFILWCFVSICWQMFSLSSIYKENRPKSSPSPFYDPLCQS